MTRVVTPGTLVDEGFIDGSENNFLLSMVVDSKQLFELFQKSDGSGRNVNQAMQRGTAAMAWTDLSSGELFTQTIDITSMTSELSRLKPREVLLQDTLQKPHGEALNAMLEDKNRVIKYIPASKTLTLAELADLVGDQDLATGASSFNANEMAAVSILMQYVNKQLHGSSLQFQSPTVLSQTEQMSIDRNSFRSLEIRETVRDGKSEGSLLHSVKRTVTKGGSRLLTQRLSKLRSYPLPLKLTACASITIFVPQRDKGAFRHGRRSTAK